MSPNGSDLPHRLKGVGGTPMSRRPMRRKLPQALAAGLVLATATGCTYEDFPRLGMPTPITEEAPRILSLWQGSWAAALATGALVWGLILWSVVFHRRSRTKVEIPRQTRYNMPLEALYTIVPLIIVSVLFYFTARDESKLLETSEKPDHVINVVGYQWSWGFNYMEDMDGDAARPAKLPAEVASIPDRYLESVPEGADGVHDAGIPGDRNPQNGNPGPTLWLPKGESVQFILTSRDVIHSFWVLPFLMKQDVIPGHTNVFEVTPTKEGTFRGKCAELCGVDHARMLFNVKVVSPERYQQHLEDLAKKGQNGYIPAGITQAEAAKNAETNNP
ncbi:MULTISPECIES: cytochrome c oxidase subunit II [Streptomyces]|uniref:cytochrome-c oxidase n=1 Tax=Streptomyces lycii TaxID=2654337 RepID=A0ABQ7FEQ4_9ACTN|nr:MULTISPECIES: cytochrome c oxidase subunit II [Streptomyces]KAF4406468.1 cytochrome c oxidase subunit II [Streptomyces lycii]PGH50747.1 cytochrome c oxidase subunit II [Streptomyces sp. Ru87]